MTSQNPDWALLKNDFGEFEDWYRNFGGGPVQSLPPLVLSNTYNRLAEQRHDDLKSCEGLELALDKCEEGNVVWVGLHDKQMREARRYLDDIIDKQWHREEFAWVQFEHWLRLTTLDRITADRGRRYHSIVWDLQVVRDLTRRGMMGEVRLVDPTAQHFFPGSDLPPLLGRRLPAVERFIMDDVFKPTISFKDLTT